MVDIIVNNESLKRKLIFTNTPCSRNGELYKKVKDELGSDFPFSIAQIQNKFKKCVADKGKVRL